MSWFTLWLIVWSPLQSKLVQSYQIVEVSPNAPGTNQGTKELLITMGLRWHEGLVKYLGNLLSEWVCCWFKWRSVFDFRELNYVQRWLCTAFAMILNWGDYTDWYHYQNKVRGIARHFVYAKNIKRTDSNHSILSCRFKKSVVCVLVISLATRDRLDTPQSTHRHATSHKQASEVIVYHGWITLQPLLANFPLQKDFHHHFIFFTTNSKSKISMVILSASYSKITVTVLNAN
jgi:hypothetical protein